MKVTVDAETTICFAIGVEHEGQKSSALVELDGGEWRLTRTPQRGTTFLAQGRINWAEAVKRGLIEISKDVGCLP